MSPPPGSARTPLIKPITNLTTFPTSPSHLTSNAKIPWMETKRKPTSLKRSKHSSRSSKVSWGKTMPDPIKSSANSSVWGTALTEFSKRSKSSSNLSNTTMRNSKNNSDPVEEIELLKLLSIILKPWKDMNSKLKLSEMRSNLYVKDNRATISKRKIFKDKKRRLSVFWNPWNDKAKT